MGEKPKSSWFEGKKKWIAGLGLAGALGGAVESDKLGVKKAGAEKDEIHHVEKKKDNEIVQIIDTFVDHQKQPSKIEKEDVSGAALDKVNQDLRSEGIRLEPREVRDGVIVCDLYYGREDEEIMTQVTVNPDGTLTLYPTTDFDTEVIVKTPQELRDKVTEKTLFEVQVDMFKSGDIKLDELQKYAEENNIKVDLPKITTRSSSTLPTGKINPADYQ